MIERSLLQELGFEKHEDYERETWIDKDLNIVQFGEGQSSIYAIEGDDISLPNFIGVLLRAQKMNLAGLEDVELKGWLTLVSVRGERELRLRAGDIIRAKGKFVVLEVPANIKATEVKILNDEEYELFKEKRKELEREQRGTKLKRDPALDTDAVAPDIEDEKVERTGRRGRPKKEEVSRQTPGKKKGKRGRPRKKK